MNGATNEPMARTVAADSERLLADARGAFATWEFTKDLIDELIDLSLNYRQSGHPGGSRSKVHMLVALMLSGAMRWDVLRPWRPFGDRFVLSAGHTIPLVYATLAALNEAMRARHQLDADPRFAFPFEGKFALTIAGAEEVKVFVFEGEGGLTPGAAHESKNSAWGLGLGNLVFLVDWNDFGIDENALSSVVHGTPEDWFAPYGWRVLGTESGMEWDEVTRVVTEVA